MSTTTKPATTETYAAAYARLSALAEKLRSTAGAPTIDGLVADVRAARDAHAVCRARLDAVKAEIELELADQPATADAAR